MNTIPLPQTVVNRVILEFLRLAAIVETRSVLEVDPFEPTLTDWQSIRNESDADELCPDEIDLFTVSQFDWDCVNNDPEV